MDRITHPATRRSLDEYAQIRYLDPSECCFKKTEGGFLSLSIGEKEQYERVDLARAFPLSDSDSYISVRDSEGNEIGMLESLSRFSDSTRRLLEEELGRRYFTPVIEKIRSIEEEFGYSYWDVDTSAGQRRFTVRRGHNNLVQLGGRRVLVIDVDGNRFEIEDYTSIDSRYSRLIESLL